MEGNIFQTLQPPVFHISKEQIRAYYHGWVLGKGSVWKDEIGTHILECAQVVLFYKLEEKILSLCSYLFSSGLI